jgi:hypothetical protein
MFDCPFSDVFLEHCAYAYVLFTLTFVHCRMGVGLKTCIVHTESYSVDLRVTPLALKNCLAKALKFVFYAI